ncbi:CPBP family intramembrane glutamic endopeptidase [Vaginisenegalia massiliensis]|uniref:CPBP family intramembrane glutamic endopeptidase n=1 Tax=Vaginisenegalia massiliensis TaxID=2058294 RepID=UPI000F536A2A|nr:type II CAAX endopeptidase family protein [Vaginisenegalia massiliensis]
MKKVSQTLLILLKAIGWYFVTTMLAMIPITVIFMTINNGNMAALQSDTYTLCSLLATGVLILVLYFFYRKRQPGLIAFEPQNMISKYGHGLLMGFCLMLVVWLLALGLGGMTTQLHVQFSRVWLIILFFFAFLIQGMSEEVLIRGYVLGQLGQFLSPIWSIVLSASLFAIMHAMNPGVMWVAILNILLFGILMGMIKHFSRSLWYVGGLHSMWNFTQGNLLGVQVSGLTTKASVFQSQAIAGHDWVSGSQFGLEASVTTTLVLAAMIGIVYWRAEQKQPGWLKTHH